MAELFITKQSGEGERFDVTKLKRSLLASGASVADVTAVLKQLTALVKPGVSTAELYRRAFQLLRSIGKSYAARYSLSRAIMQLGPSGFPFEQYVAAVLEVAGYQTCTNQIFQGKCLTHEVDVVAEKPAENIHAIIEVKFHNRPGNKTGSKDILYTHARFLDINQEWVVKRARGAKPQGGELQSWLFTNTKVTTDVIQYARCAGLRITSWDYPADASFKKMIDTHLLYPITVLLGLNADQKNQLLRARLVLCRDLLEPKNEKMIHRLGLGDRKIKLLLNEVQSLLNGV
ncbi:MAG: hypothetical protein A2951_01395 [Candidatus Buchananbacteria bacterium RIFCSPLOWO2_01_FULL_56_15]|uniref:ATP-cone domain-containing protein n=3 Tax=Candidatus Buchananiibacteriota TaxID=1817903 RepID=A0A1G1YT41_9BACT|nr:MAG: hypothetical protein A2951_01395 [Candidatus Buchananbacteria bacterium RIFCSPLOWO2_01_FULL_56_15]